MTCDPYVRGPRTSLDAPASVSGINHVVFIGPRLPAMEGGSTAVVALSRGLAAAGLMVSHISVFPGQSRTRFPTWTILPREAIHRSPVLRGAPTRPRRLMHGVPRVIYKRTNRRCRLRQLRLHLEALDGHTAVVFTHVLAKQIVDESGYRRTAGGPRLIAQHHSQFASLMDEPWLMTAMPTAFADVDLFVALTATDATEFEQILDVPCISIPNASAPPGSPSRQDRHLAVVLARLSHEKQLPLLVEMFAAATSTAATSDWELEIYGEGEEEGAIREEIRKRSAGRRVRLMGRTDDPASVLSHASINLLASRLEGFGLTIVEAAGARVPTIAFDCSPGVHGLLSGGAGIPVANQDKDAYVDALKHFMTDPAARREAGRVARERSRRFAPNTIASLWIEAFAKLETGSAGQRYGVGSAGDTSARTLPSRNAGLGQGE